MHGGTLLQPSPNFTGDYAIPSPQLNADQKKKEKKGLRRRLKCVFPEIIVKTKKKKCLPQFGTTFGRNLLDFPLWLAFFRLIIQRSNLDGLLLLLLKGSGASESATIR